MRNLALAATVAALMVAPLGCILAASHVKETTVAQPSGATAGASTSSGRAHFLVKIMCDENLLPLDHKLVESILKSPSVDKEAAQEVFGESVEHIVEFGQIAGARRTPYTMSPDGQRILLGELSVQVLSERAKPRSDEFLEAVCKRLREALADAWKRENQRLEEQVQQASKLLDQTESKIAALERIREDVSAVAGLADPSRSSVRAMIRFLESKQQSLEMSLMGMKARQGAIADKIAELGQQTRDRVKDDAVATELAKIVTLREAELKRLREAKAQGAAAAAEVDAAEGRLAEAKVKLAERREAAKGTGRIELLEKLSNEIVTLGIDIAEKTSSLKALSQQVAKLKDPKVLEAADRYDREVGQELRSAQQTCQEVRLSLDRLKREGWAAKAPSVTVIGKKSAD